MNDNGNLILAKYGSVFFWGLAFVLILPIIVLPPHFQPSDWNRAMLFRIVLTGLVIFFVYRYSFKKEPIPLPKIKNPVFLPVAVLLGFVFFVFLSLLFSQDIRFSFFGSPSRAGGFLNLLFYVFFAGMLVYFGNQDKWKKLFNVLLVAGTLASLLAMLQYFNVFGKLFLAYEGGGTPSFLGSSTFFAIYMLFLVFWALTLFIQEKNLPAGRQAKAKKRTYLALFCLFTFSVLISGSRAAYLGVLAGSIFYLIFFPKKLKILKISAAVLILFAILVVTIFNFFPQISEKNSLLSVVASRVSIKKIATDLAGTRFAAWQITWEAIKEKPLLGWGPENSYIGFEKHFDPTISNLQKLWWDRPHNIFLEIWSNSGIFALIFYIAFWAVLIWRLHKLNSVTARGIQAMFIGYLTVLFFNFDNFSTYLISFFFIGYSLFLISSQSHEYKTIFLPSKKPFIVFLAVLAALFIFFWNIKPLYLNAKIAYINDLANAKQCKKVLSAADSSNWQKSGILAPYAALKYADTIKKCAFVYPKKEVEYSKKALESLKLAAKLQPNWSRTWLLMGTFENVIAARETDPENKKNLLAEAQKHLEKSLELSPKRQEVIEEMEKNRLVAQDYQAMKKIAYTCIDIDSSQGICYWYLGVAEIFLGEQENGETHIHRAEEIKSSNYPYIQLGVAYLSQKNYQGAARTYEIISGLDSKNASYHAVLGAIYKELGEYEKAGKQAIRVFELEPENKESIEFLRVLLGLVPNDPSIHGSLAYIYKQSGQKEKAREEYMIIKSIYLKALAREPENAVLHFGLALIYKELGEKKNADKEARTAEKLDPERFGNQIAVFLQSLY